ncbi:hypothetical protein N1495_06705 [Streptococcus didelphis]|nr:hypothetical protein [Streptococcus didelphis]WMB29118.1 hypothetical protein N1495_06705 [Streptococcus didelphis]
MSAGLSSYLFAHQLGKTSYQHLNQKGDEWNYLGMLLVTFGWFGFNAGPVGQLNQAAGLALLNTLLAMLAGGLSWSVLHYVSQKRSQQQSFSMGLL